MNEMLQTLGENAREAEVILRNLGTAKKNQVLETALWHTLISCLRPMP